MSVKKDNKTMESKRRNDPELVVDETIKAEIKRAAKGKSIILKTSGSVKYISSGSSGGYPGLEEIQETVLVEWDESGVKCIGTFFYFQIHSV
jgi:hypothetical protein